MEEEPKPQQQPEQQLLTIGARPVPVPFGVICERLRQGTPTRGGQLTQDAIMLVFETPTGAVALFAPLDQAKAIADRLNELVTGITIAPPTLASQLAALNGRKRR